MGKLVFGMMQSLDGYIAGVDGSWSCRHRALRSFAIGSITFATSPAVCTVVACTR